jgi:peroxiredoxin
LKVEEAKPFNCQPADNGPVITPIIYSQNSFMKKVLLSVALLLSIGIVSAQEGPNGLEVNAIAPDFTAKDQSGAVITLKEKLKKGPVVLIFYRGYWCPHCSKQLKKLEDSLLQITNKGATLVAITPEQPENINKSVEKSKITYPVIFDDGLKIMKSYDVAYTVDEKTIKTYKGYGIDFTKVNGETNGNNLPVPATFVINKEGKIIYRHFDKDYTKRPSVAEILKKL